MKKVYLYVPFFALVLVVGFLCSSAECDSEIIENLEVVKIANMEVRPGKLGGQHTLDLTVAIENKNDRAIKLSTLSCELEEEPLAERGVPETSIKRSEAKLLKELQMDIVYVVDMTGSMQPYIDATLKVIRDISRTMAHNAEVAQSIQFGLWGYRDSVGGSPGTPDTEFITKNFTPQLQQIHEFEKALAMVQAKEGGDSAEDLFSGVDHALKQTSWTQNALHFIVLIGDAPGHLAGDARNLSKQTASSLRKYADSPNNFFVYALHIKDPGVQALWGVTGNQLKTLSQNPGMKSPSYWSVMSNDGTGFERTSRAIAGELVSLMKAAKEGDLSEIESSTFDKERVENSVIEMGHTALVQWLDAEKIAKGCPYKFHFYISDPSDFAPKIYIGPDTAYQTGAILLKANTLTEVTFSIRMGTRELSELETILSVLNFLGKPSQKRYFFIEGKVDMGIQTEKGWSYAEAIQIEWMLCPRIRHDLPLRSCFF